MHLSAFFCSFVATICCLWSSLFKEKDLRRKEKDFFFFCHAFRDGWKIFFYFFLNTSHPKKPPWTLVLWTHKKHNFLCVTWHIPAAAQRLIIWWDSVVDHTHNGPRENYTLPGFSENLFDDKRVVIIMSIMQTGQALNNFRSCSFIVSWLFGQYKCKGNFQFMEQRLVLGNR